VRECAVPLLVRAPAAEVEAADEAWDIYKSVFAPRLKEADARSFWETEKVVARAFEVDWRRMLDEPRVRKYVGEGGRGGRG
jgi:hypothetical protein